MRKRRVITGSEGLIGKGLVSHFSALYEVISLDLSLGNDLSDEAFVEKWFRENSGLYGMIVCHARNPIPVKSSKKIEPTDISLADVRRYFEVNTISAFSVCQHFIKNNKKGVIVNLSSVYGALSPRHEIYKDFVKPIGYSMSKASIVIMSKYLATYYAPDIRVNTVVLGGVADSKQDLNFVKEYSLHTPAGRLMNLEEVTSVFDFLLSEKSSYITGSELYVDGGWTAW